MERWIRSSIHGVVLLGAITSIGSAQVPDSARRRARADSARAADSVSSRRDAQRILDKAHRIRWYEVAAVTGGVALVSLVDEQLSHEVQEHRSQTLNDVAWVFRQQGEPWYYAGVSLGVFGAGVVANSPDLRRAGRRLVVSVAGAGIATGLLKRVIGRSRPNEGVGAHSFHPFTTLKDSLGVQTRGAFPSGHTTAAFAVATSIADDIDHPVATIALYTIATGAAWSRIYDNRHWLSDTVFGAALGIATAKIANGRWRIFGWRPPAMMVRPTGEVAMGWSATF